MTIINVNKELIDFGNERIVKWNESDVSVGVNLEKLKFSQLDYFDLLTEKVDKIVKERGYSGHKRLMHKKDEKYCAFIDENGHIDHLISLSSLHIPNYIKKLRVKFYGNGENEINRIAENLEDRLKKIVIEDVGSKLYTTPNKEGRKIVAKGVELFFTEDYTLKINY